METTRKVKKKMQMKMKKRGKTIVPVFSTFNQKIKNITMTKSI